MVLGGSEDEQAQFRMFQDGMKESFFAMTTPPESGDRAWRDQQVEVLCVDVVRTFLDEQTPR